MNGEVTLNQILWLAGTLAGAAGLGYFIHRVLWLAVSQFAQRTSTMLDDSLAKHCRAPSTLIVPILLVFVVRPMLAPRVGPPLMAVLVNALTVLLPLAIGWTLIRLTSVAEDVILAKHDITVADNLRARAVHTQFRIVKRICTVIIGVLTLAIVLMSFEQLRHLGAGLLASAGIAGLVIGLAAQKALANLLAGIQIALTQPIRLDDVVVVEGEWGKIEEISLTYVVVRIWDLRRLVLPISYFLDHPFQNWTRTSADILGTIYLHMDHTVPVDAVRGELKRIVEQSDEWDGKVCGVQVTNTSPQGIEVRALISAADSSKAWDLRCEVRERLIDFLRENYPHALPRIRTEVHGWPTGEAT